MSAFPNGMWTNLTPYDCLQVFLDEADAKFCQSNKNTDSSCHFKPYVLYAYSFQSTSALSIVFQHTNWFNWQNCESISFQTKFKLDFSIYTEQICGYDPSKNACQGDSGGPMTVMDANTQYLVGVTSYGDPNCGAEE